MPGANRLRPLPPFPIHRHHHHRLLIVLCFCAGLSSMFSTRALAQDDDSFTGSFLLDIFDTLTSTADAKDCPGVCVHIIATTICYDVLEDVACPSASMKCCIEGPGPNSTSTAKNETSISGSSSPTTVQETRSTTTPPPTSVMVTQNKTTTATKVANSGKNETSSKCPGVCAPANISDYCEAIIPNDTLCEPNAKCCVVLDDAVPDNVIIPNAHIKNRTQAPELKTTPFPITAVTEYSKVVSTTSPSFPTKTCKGECIGGIFALSCYDIDWEAQCPEGSSCCIESFWDFSSSSTHIPPTRIISTSTTTTTTTPRTTISTSMGPKCPGTCYLSIMVAFCVRPAVLIQNTSCKRGTICCDNRQLSASPRPKPTPYRTSTVPSTTIVTTVDPRPECPGSCIVSYLSFTCFRNAEMTDIFKCKKFGHKCCAPKSIIREMLDLKGESSFEGHPTSTVLPSSVGLTTPFLTTTEATAITFSGYTKTTPSNWKSPTYNKYVCGVKGNSRTRRVVGGEDGEQGEWCWQVALINSLNQYLCGAALIGTQWVLTAAHCVTNIVRAGDTIYVRVGDHDLTKKYGSPGAQTLRVATTYIHHNHNSQTLDNDIALLKLHGQAELKEGVCLVCLPARGVNHAAGKRCTVTGYGYMGESGPIPLRVREAEIPIVSDPECRRKVNAVTEKIFILPASSFCAGGEQGNDACQGDGGGPLVCQDDGFYELVGLVSWGFGCGRQDVPGVYVKVSSFIGWINQIISVNNL
ncbi:protein masquerade [Agrilus planipennis]|uniref:Protein masquerade n=1 Tax=Agrilus planipennis TaxID=224129 RepID=A0A1W4X873_AGRPL|nr:protein masquerade [Agrilus planipennis]